LTISDAHSRYLLRCQAVEKTDTARVQAIFEAAFREYGMPEAIRTDNGAPFASRAVAGLSRLAVWWIKLGIVPERIEAGHPEQNGRHERMHRTLKQEAAQPPASNRRQQQRALDRFRQEYNQVRPHEALEMQTPAAVYQPSARKFPARVLEPQYPQTMQVRSVRVHGHFRWKKHDVFLSEVLWGEHVGLWPEDDRWFTIYFAQLPLHPISSPSRSRKCQTCARSKMSGIPPAAHGNLLPAAPAAGRGLRVKGRRFWRRHTRITMLGDFLEYREYEWQRPRGTVLGKISGIARHHKRHSNYFRTHAPQVLPPTGKMSSGARGSATLCKLEHTLLATAEVHHLHPSRPTATEQPLHDAHSRSPRLSRIPPAAFDIFRISLF